MALALSVREAGPKLNLGLTASGFFSPTTLFPLGTQIVKLFTSKSAQRGYSALTSSAYRTCWRALALT